MQDLKAIAESFIQKSYPDLDIPQHWMVLYQEAIRGHHILFAPSEISAYQELTQTEMPRMSDDEIEEAARICTDLISCPDYRAMTDLLDSVDAECRVRIIHLYFRLLSAIQAEFRSMMN